MGCSMRARNRNLNPTMLFPALVCALATAACVGKLEPSPGPSGADPGADTSDAGPSTLVTGPCNGRWQNCVTAEGEDGVAACSGNVTASACGLLDLANGCYPGDEYTGGAPPDCSTACALDASGPTWRFPACNVTAPSGGSSSGGASSSSGTPLVLAFAGESVRFTGAAGDFDLMGREASVATDWVSPETPWLALDRDGNGTIDDGRELFGSMTVLTDGQRAPNGFVALAALDDDGDGLITAHDASFGRLLVWRDANQDRRSEPGELTSAEAAGLVSIDLGYRDVPRCSGDDCEIERAHFVFREGGRERTGDVIDVHLGER
jgi:hypothetical protein